MHRATVVQLGFVALAFVLVEGGARRAPVLIDDAISQVANGEPQHMRRSDITRVAHNVTSCGTNISLHCKMLERLVRAFLVEFEVRICAIRIVDHAFGAHLKAVCLVLDTEISRLGLNNLQLNLQFFHELLHFNGVVDGRQLKNIHRLEERLLWHNNWVDNDLVLLRPQLSERIVDNIQVENIRLLSDG